MSSYTAIFDDTNTFENWSWALGSTYNLNSYSDIGIEIYLFTSTNFDTYKTWLLTGNASGRVSNDTVNDPQLTSATLQSFRSKITDYDGGAILMYVTHEIFSVAQQESAGCIHEPNYGMTCAVVTTDTGASNAEMGRSYWFPDTSTTQLQGISGGTYDVWADTTSHLIADYYAGLTRW